MNTKIKSGALAGIDGLSVTVEVDISRGLPGFHLVGLPNAEVRESRQRVLAALRNSGVRLPPGKITVNLAPAGIRKEGASFDLAIAVGVMAAQGVGINKRCVPEGDAPLFLGELSLFGQLRPVRGLLAMVLAAAEQGDRLVVVPAEQAGEASLATGVRVVGASHLSEVFHWWQTGEEPALNISQHKDSFPPKKTPDKWLQLAGQPSLLKAAVLAVAGRHNIMMVGPPGTGKTRLARILGACQAPLGDAESLEVTRIHSAAGLLPDGQLLKQRPFRAPHHTLTRAGLIGGGAALRPGEVTLAHGGILFLDEFSEFPPAVLDVLREPMEEKVITLDRGGRHRQYPANFQILAAMNPCRCGFLGSGIKPCRCTDAQQRRYLSRLSGPLLDRFDLFVQVGPWEGSFLSESHGPRVCTPGKNWRELTTTGAWPHLARLGAQTESLPLSRAAKDHLNDIRLPLGLSIRSVKSCLRVANTVALLDGCRKTERRHVLEALEFRLENLALESVLR
ncbi:MAG: YifB family Mg chelatase-like AAA ATPase [bacterium]|nr:YifB family Mg chelatase-like AAA ATPase [bacterium]